MRGLKSALSVLCLLGSSIVASVIVGAEHVNAYCNPGDTTVTLVGGQETVGFAGTCNSDGAYSGSLADIVTDGHNVSIWAKAINGSTVYVRKALTSSGMSVVSYGYTDADHTAVFKMCGADTQTSCTSVLINSPF
jgi:hypothetical protein